MKKLIRLVCLLLCLTLLPLTAPAQTSSPLEKPAPDVRVLLRRLGLTDRADLVLDGVYTASVGGRTLLSFPQGAEVTVQLREGDMYLFYAGMSLLVGDHMAQLCI